MINKTSMITVGRFGAAHGVKGWMKVQSFTQPFDNLMSYQPWYIKHENEWQPIKLSGCRIQHDTIVAAVEGCDVRELTIRYRNVEIAIPRAEFPVLPEGEYYWTDLEGLTVYTENGEQLGRLEYLFATGANDVMVIKGEEEHLLPYRLGDVIINIDLTARKMLVKWDKNF